MAVYLGKKKIGVTILTDKEDDLNKELTEQEALLNELEEDVNALSDKDEIAKQIIDGTIEEFDNTKIGATFIEPYRFINFDSLKSANFTGIYDIPIYTCENCTKLTELIVDPKTTKIGSRAFFRCPLNGFVLKTDVSCAIEQYAFYESKIAGIDATLKSVGEYAFSGLSELSRINVKLQGSLSTSAFMSAINADVFEIVATRSVTGVISNYCFSNAGKSRVNPENKIFNFDFSDSKITAINQYGFGYNLYTNIRLPETLKTINQNAFKSINNVMLYFKGLVPATLNANAFTDATNFKICVPYDALNAYKTATNWVTYANNIVGYADKDGFVQGQQLPKYSAEGYELTWYSDSDLTQQVMMVENSNNYYYCAISSEQPVEVISINLLYEEDCNVVVMDDANNRYYQGYAIPVGAQLTITSTPTLENNVPYILTLNDNDISESQVYTTLSGTNITLVGVYYDGVNPPINADLNKNSWAVIRKVVRDGNAGQYWTIGQTKDLEVDGYVYQVRLSDLKAGRYGYVNSDRTTNAVFEFVQLYATQYRINPSSPTIIGWSDCELRTTLNTTILNLFPLELRGLLNEILIPDEGKNSTETSSNYLFIQSRKEMRNYAYNQDMIWDYYTINSSQSDRIKYRVQYPTSGYQWWTRTGDGASGWIQVTSIGGEVSTSATSTVGVCPCLAW